MQTKRFVTLIGATAAITLGSMAVAAPAGAVGTRNGKCTYYDSFVGTSTATGNSFTAGQSGLCGKVKVRVGYNVSGGSAVYTPWRTGSGTVYQGPVGYRVFGGEHTVTNPAFSVGDPLIRS